MDILLENPPNIDAIDAKFHVKGKQVLFAYGDKIYNPLCVNVPPYLLAHEKMHGERQVAMGIDAWWEKYIEDTTFRLEEEIIAHQVELRARLINGGSRQVKRGIAKLVAKRLAAPLYGRMITNAEARLAMESALEY